ncbi:MAG: P-type conjugative transfer protein TrbG [Caulobacterales bacterium]
MRHSVLRALGASGLAIGIALATASDAASAGGPAAADLASRAAARRHHQRHYAPAEASLRTVAVANRSSLSRPSSGAYVNATLYYDYEPGRLYTLNTSPRFLTAITLRPGEKLISKAAGDTVRWVLGETVEGAGATEQVIVFVKPIRGDLRTNIILTTDQRTYLLEAVSHDGDSYTSVVSWNYPQEEMREQLAARAAAEQSAVAATSVENLNFSYKVEPVHARHGPRWQPLRVFDDGLKTYIQFPPNLASSEAPPLFLIGPHDQAELVNYRLMGGYYVVDRLIDVAELRLGEKPQTVVRITRTGGTGPAGQGG